jgi:hypothetical protein
LAPPGLGEGDTEFEHPRKIFCGNPDGVPGLGVVLGDPERGWPLTVAVVAVVALTAFDSDHPHHSGGGAPYVGDLELRLPLFGCGEFIRKLG